MATPSIEVRSYSLRRRLTAALALAFAVLALGGAAAIDHALEQRLSQDFDAGLRTSARALISLTDQEEGQIEFDYQHGVFPEFEREQDPDHFQFWLDDGQMLLRSTQLEGDLPRVPTSWGSALLFGDTEHDGRRLRWVRHDYVPHGPADPLDSDPISPAPGPDGVRGLTLVVARDPASLDALLAHVRWWVFGTGGTAALLALLLVWNGLLLGFRPIRQLAAQVGGLDAEQLDRRVALRRTPAEMLPVVRQTNALLDRLEAAFGRERRFAGNVAHELRTPIAELRSLASVAEAWPDDPRAVAAFFGDVGQIADRMERVVADLLLLARCQAGVEPTRMAVCPLRPAVERAFAPLAAEAKRRGLRLELRVPAPATARTDAGKLELILGNLLGNAVSYALPRTTIHCALDRADGGWTIRLRNGAHSLRPDELARLREPFWRKDTAGSSADHAGLGAALAAALADLLGLQLDFTQACDGTFCATLAGLEPGADREQPARILPLTPQPR